MSSPCWTSRNRLTRVRPLALLGGLALFALLPGCAGSDITNAQSVPLPPATDTAPPQQFSSEAARQAELSRQINAINGLQSTWERQQRQQPIPPLVNQQPPAVQEPPPTVISGWDANARPQEVVPVPSGGDLGSTHIPDYGSTYVTDNQDFAPSSGYQPAPPAYVPTPSVGVEYSGPVYQGRSGVSYVYSKDRTRSRRTYGPSGYDPGESLGGSYGEGDGYRGYTDTTGESEGLRAVHITASGRKYHSAGCRYLTRSDQSVTLRHALARGLTPCSRCSP